MKIGLINTNRLQPPVAPIGLDYVAEALHAAGHDISLLDLCWEEDPESAILKFLNDAEFGMTRDFYCLIHQNRSKITTTIPISDWSKRSAQDIAAPSGTSFALTLGK